MKTVIALDDSPYSQHVLDSICRRHWAPDSEFKIVHVVEPLDSAEWSFDGWLEICQEMTQRRHQHAEKLCSDARLKLEKQVPDAIVHYEIREGKAKSEIVYAAAAWDAQKIIIGAHGPELCPPNTLGSVSRGVVEHSSCAVEIIRGASAVQPSVKHAIASGKAP